MIGCTLTIAGEEEELLDAAVAHAVDKHGHENTPELREQIRAASSTPNRDGLTPDDPRPARRRGSRPRVRAEVVGAGGRA